MSSEKNKDLFHDQDDQGRDISDILQKLFSKRDSEKFKKLQIENKNLKNKLKGFSEHNSSTLLKKINDLTTELAWLQNVQEENEKLKKEIKKKAVEVEEMQEALQKLVPVIDGINNFEDEKYNDLAAVYADYMVLHYDLTADYLDTKKRPARAKAREVRELKAQTKIQLEKFRLIQYKLEAIIQLFPDLEGYMESFEDIKELDNADNLQSFQDDFDRTQNFLSKEEYLGLNEVERNQMALDRYAQGKKSKWQIGRDYEMSCGYMLKNEGFLVNYFGIEQRIKDLGRDLIAVRDNTHYIVQCKYWSKQKVIHEKHITQLFGTTIEYELEKLDELRLIQPFEKVVPMFMTNISLSDTARKFAKRLGVEVREQVEMKEFPRIKCNSGKDEKGQITKIYHLPFDQQYDRTVVSNIGDTYAFTVKEAVDNGYRRAFRYRWRQ